MTEIMPFPENNILFYWAALHGRAFFNEIRSFGTNFISLSAKQKISQ